MLSAQIKIGFVPPERQGEKIFSQETRDVSKSILSKVSATEGYNSSRRLKMSQSLSLKGK